MIKDMPQVCVTISPEIMVRRVYCFVIVHVNISYELNIREHTIIGHIAVKIKEIKT